jgi:hypothetical protein
MNLKLIVLQKEKKQRSLSAEINQGLYSPKPQKL